MSPETKTKMKTWKTTFKIKVPSLSRNEIQNGIVERIPRMFVFAGTSSSRPIRRRGRARPSGSSSRRGRRGGEGGGGGRKRNNSSASHLAHQRHAANLRERRRMQSINDAFEGLRWFGK